MALPERVETRECPLLRPGLSAGLRAGLSAAIYCALPGGRVKVPTRDEIERFCVPSDFKRCPAYQRYADR